MLTHTQGPPETPYEGQSDFVACTLTILGGKFTLEITVPKEYPLHPPDVKFVTKVFHPNIHFKVCKRHTICSYDLDWRHLLGLAEERMVCHFYSAEHLPLHYLPSCASGARQSSQL